MLELIQSAHSYFFPFFFISVESTSLTAKQIPGIYQLTLFLSSASEIQVCEESLSQVNSALKQATIELETVRGEVLALKDTKDLVTKEINDLQQTLTGKLVLRE